MSCVKKQKSQILNLFDCVENCSIIFYWQMKHSKFETVACRCVTYSFIRIFDIFANKKSKYLELDEFQCRWESQSKFSSFFSSFMLIVYLFMVFMTFIKWIVMICVGYSVMKVWNIYDLITVTIIITTNFCWIN